MDFQKSSCDVGMHFGKLRDLSAKIGNYKNLRMLSGKRRMHSVSGRHNDDRIRETSNFYLEDIRSFFFIISDPFRYLPTSHGVCRSPLDPRYVNNLLMKPSASWC